MIFVSKYKISDMEDTNVWRQNQEMYFVMWSLFVYYSLYAG